MITAGGCAEWSPAGSAAPAHVLLVTGISESVIEPLCALILCALIRRTGRKLKGLFIDCDDEPLQRRYIDRRRPHPPRRRSARNGRYRLERRVVSALRDRADLVIDTCNLSVADLKRLLTGFVALAAGGLRVFVTSFAYRRGIPRDADLMFDVELAHLDLVQSGSPALVASGAPPAAS